MAKKVLVDSKTGEVIEAQEICPYRTILDADEYNDSETYEQGTSVTTLDGYEPLESIVARCMRTTHSPNGTEYQVLDLDALKAEETQQGVYDAAGAKDIDEAFATLDPTESQGFDLADVSAIQNRVSEELRNASVAESSAELSTKGENEAPTSSVVNDVVGKSASTNDATASRDEVATREETFFPERKE